MQNISLKFFLSVLLVSFFLSYCSSGKYPQLNPSSYSEFIRSDDPEELYLIGISMQEMGEWEKSLSFFKKAVALEKDFKEASLQLGLTYLKTKKYTRAVNIFKKIIEKEPDEKVYLYLGISYLYRGEIEKAKRQYRQAIALKGNYPDAYYHLGIIYWLQKDKELAIKNLQKAIQYQPDYLEPRKILGKIYLNNHQYQETIAVYKEILHFQPENISALFHQGLAHLSLKNYDSARNSLEDILRIQDDPQAHLLLAEIYKRLQLYRESILHLEALIKLRPEQAELYYEKGKMEGMRGDLKTAFLSFKKAIQLRKNYPEAYFSLGLIYEKLGKYDLAQKSFKKALKQDYFPAYFGLGLVYLKQGKGDKAISAFQRAVRQRPNSLAANTNLVYGYLKLNQYRKAIEIFRKAITNNYNDAMAHYDFALINFFKGKEQITREELNTLKKLKRIDLAAELSRLILEREISIKGIAFNPPGIKKVLFSRRILKRENELEKEVDKAILNLKKTELNKLIQKVKRENQQVEVKQEEVWTKIRETAYDDPNRVKLILSVENSKF